MARTPVLGSLSLFWLVLACAGATTPPVVSASAVAKPAKVPAARPPASGVTAEVKWHVLVNDQDSALDDRGIKLVLPPTAEGVTCVVTEVFDYEKYRARRLKCLVGDREVATMAGCSRSITEPQASPISLEERMAISSESSKTILAIAGKDQTSFTVLLECATVGAAGPP